MEEVRLLAIILKDMILIPPIAMYGFICPSVTPLTLRLNNGVDTESPNMKVSRAPNVF